MALLGAVSSATAVGTQAAADADLGAQTVTATLTTAAEALSTQTAVTNIVADLNDLKAKLRTAGVLAP